MATAKKGVKNTRHKGSLLEDLVAELHEEPGIKIEKRVKLPALNSRRVIKRELDVLLTALVAGHRIQIAISCKNERKKLTINDVDSFVQSLQDVGIPVQQSVMVCVKGATKDAVESAKLKGIKIYTYKGLDECGLKEKVQEAIQTQVFCMLVGRQFSTFDYIEDKSAPPTNSVLIKMSRPQGHPGLSILECLHKNWNSRLIPNRLGDATIFIRPNDVDEKWCVIADVSVVGLVGHLTGVFRHKALADCNDETINKFRISAEFSAPTGSVNLALIENEDTLSEVKRDIGLQIINRIRVPRINWNNLYWPMTKAEYQKLKVAKENGQPVGLGEDYMSNLANAWPEN